MSDPILRPHSLRSSRADSAASIDCKNSDRSENLNINSS